MKPRARMFSPAKLPLDRPWSVAIRVAEAGKGNAETVPKFLVVT
jgi:hypothetical protein